MIKIDRQPLSVANMVRDRIAKRIVSFLPGVILIAVVNSVGIVCADQQWLNESTYAASFPATSLVREPKLTGVYVARAHSPVAPPHGVAYSENHVGSCVDWSEFDRSGACASCEPWRWQVLPEGVIYRSYLASEIAPRLGAAFNFEQGRDDWVWDLAIGGRVAVIRYGTTDGIRPEGWELGVAAGAFPRLTPIDLAGTVNDGIILEATDYRFGIPLTYGRGCHQFKVGYYHMSSHLGDEYAQLFGGLGQRINFVEDSIIFGYSHYRGERLRLYAEGRYAFSRDFAQPWRVQIGAEYSQLEPTGNEGAPFFAVNAHLREENNFSGNLVVQLGWQWTAKHNGHRLRIGGQYYNGTHEKYQFFDETEQKVGFGIWYDF